MNRNQAYVFWGDPPPPSRVPIGIIVHCFDLSTQEWSVHVCQPQNKDNEPQPTNAAAVAALWDSMYLFGGGGGSIWHHDGRGKH